MVLRAVGVCSRAGVGHRAGEYGTSRTPRWCLWNSLQDTAYFYGSRDVFSFVRPSVFREHLDAATLGLLLIMGCVEVTIFQFLYDSSDVLLLRVNCFRFISTVRY